MTTSAFDLALDCFVGGVQKKVTENEAGSTVMRTIVRVERGKRYARIVKHCERTNDRYVHSFIDMESGDILKAASWKAPAKNGVRGSIYADDHGMSVVGPYGCHYLCR